MSDEEFSDAVDQAARLLMEAGLPVIAGMGTDIAGVAAACRLAEKVGAAIDHDSAEATLREQAVLSDTGAMFVSPGEARAAADAFLIVGDPAADWPELADLLKRDAAGDVRKIVRLSSRGVDVDEERTAQPGAGKHGLHGVLAALRARVNGNPLADDHGLAGIEECAARLTEAEFGVAIWSPSELDGLAIEMLTGLVKDLNESSRWSSLLIPLSVTATGAAMAAGWLTALPLRSAFLGGRWEHDPWRFEARRLIESGETDAVLYICSYGDPLPEWLSDVPRILLVRESIPAQADAVRFDIACPGRDHDAILFDRRTGTLSVAPATEPTNEPTVAEVLDRIAARVALP